MHKLGFTVSSVRSTYFLVGIPICCRMGFARLAEDSIRKVRGKKDGESLGAIDKIIASSIGGALATWNQPIEVVRVEVKKKLTRCLRHEKY